MKAVLNLKSYPLREGNAEPLSREATNANPRQLPMPRTVTLPALWGESSGFADEVKSPRRSRAVARALDVQRQSLVWPVTASARGGSFFARPGTCRASSAAPLAVP